MKRSWMSVLAVSALVSLAACGSDRKEVGSAVQVSADAAAAAPADTQASAAETTAAAAVSGELVVEATVPADSAPARNPTSGVIPAAPAGNQIREVDIAIDVPTDDFAQTVNEVSALATQVGGFVASSDVQSVEGVLGAREPATASLVIRVPSSTFAEVERELRSLGDVTSISYSGQEVSAQLVDLNARVETLRAQETAYNQLLENATTTADIITLSNELNGVRTQIEQISAQRESLKDRVAFSTFTVRIDEKFAVVAPVSEPAEERGRFEQVWDGSTDALVAVVTGLGLVLVALAPFALALSPVVVVAWLVARRRRRAVAAAEAAPHWPTPASQPRHDDEAGQLVDQSR
jgi:hypothetical protein